MRENPAMNALMQMLLRGRRRLRLPDERGWTPVLLLGYLVFLFVPFVFSPATVGTGAGLGMPRVALWPTLLSVALFLPLYLRAWQVGGVVPMLGIAALGFLLLPANPFANTYLIYACGFAAFVPGTLWRRLGWMLLLCAAFAAEIAWLRYPPFVTAISLIISVAVFSGNHYQRESERRRAELRLSHDEVRRLAALAERERIGRDLHDLLGHTLSLVALKSDLAGRLIDRDPAAARRELDELGGVARQALAQVRGAVAGIRAAALAAELAAARLLLESDGVAFRYELDASFSPDALPPGVETALAMTVREAVTNIQRHARASSAEVSVAQESGEAVLRIRDDGRGGAIVPGNGLSGMRERLSALRGRLRIDAASGHGTLLEARIPLAANDDAPAA